MSKKSRSPIFAHSLFRSGSTYLFSVFRRASEDGGEKLYTAFQEPIHEAVIDAATDPNSLNFFSGVGAIPKTLRHPEIGASYFAEMIEIAAAWAPFADPEIVYDGYFGGAAEVKTVRFMNSLIKAAPRRPVFCDCRTAARIGMLRRELGGIHFYLWRNPWDQWWSLKATDYFDSINQVIASVTHAPEPLRRLATEIGLRQPAAATTKERMEFFNERRLAAEHGYQLHFMLWMLALDSGISSADFNVNIDKLSEDASYRDTIAAKFEAVGATGLDFSDAAVPRSAFDEEDAAFFNPLEMRVRAILLESGWSAAQLEAVDTARHLNAPQSIDARGEGRLREVMRRTETRDAGIARKFERETAAAIIDAENLRAIATGVHAAIAESVSAVRAEASNNRVRLDAIITDARSEIARLSGANAEITRSLEAERVEHARAAGALATTKAEYENVKAALAGEIDLHAQTRTALMQATEVATSAAAENDQLKAEFQKSKAALDDELARHSQTRTELMQATEAARLTALHEDDARKLAAVRAELESESVRTRDAQWEAKRNALHADDLEHRLAALYASTSWQATAPLRAVSLASRAAFAALKTAVKAVARPPLAIALKTIRLAPPLKNVLLRTARAVPAIGDPFLKFALARPPENDTKILVKGNDFKANVSRKISIANLSAPQSPSNVSGRTLYYFVDHTVGCPVNTGMQRVVRGLATGLAARDETLVFVRWSRTSKRLVRVDRDQLAHLAKWSGPDADVSAYPARGDAERPIPIHSPDDESWLIVPEVTHINAEGDNPTLDVIMAAKQAKLRTAFVFYDAIPLRRPEFSESAPRHERYMRALLLADLIAPISAWSGRDLESFFVDHEKSNLESGSRISPLLLPFASTVKAHSQNNRPRENLILAVGTIELRKNQGALLEAFEAFKSSGKGDDWRLELIGNLHPNMADAVHAAVARNSSISHRANISDEDLADLYDRAAFTVFPSVEEGFGLPIVESLAHGAPCICANFGAMAELAEDGGCLAVDTHDAAAIAEAIETLALDKVRRATLTGEAKARHQTTWTDYSDAFLKEMAAQVSPLSLIGRIYYFVDQTASFHSNTGIQRVVRALARSLQNLSADIRPVKWSMTANDFSQVSQSDLEHLAKWNGPDPLQWGDFDKFAKAGPRDWLLVPEVLSSPSGPAISKVHEAARRRGLRIAWIFYDAIPWKLDGLYPPEAKAAHGAYMRDIADAELILSISSHSNEDYLEFARSTLNRTPNLYERVLATPLPGEFGQSKRSLEPHVPPQDRVNILSVGTIEPRKNHLALLDAFEKLCANDVRPERYRLTLVGIDPYPVLAAQIEARVERNPAISWIKRASDAELLDLYRDAHFTVYPSLEEGFGLPILESLWNARPCICRNTGAMAEIAEGGGCMQTDTADPDAIASAIKALSNDRALYERLEGEALSRKFSTWRDYGRSVLDRLANERHLPTLPYNDELYTHEIAASTFANLSTRPKLSICITTYNRAEWLRVCLLNLARLIPEPREEIEILVVDNTSTDHTPEIVEPYVRRSDFRSIRNRENVGMLGNLRVTADAARGEYVWIIGDDDLPAPGSIEAIIAAIENNDDAALIYLNYAYTREDNARMVTDLDAYFASSTPITPSAPDRSATIAALSTQNENFFTAIYCLVFRRDHALRAYTQDTSGRPFSTMRTCIPTTYHVLHHMMHEKGVWLGKPQIVVNMNVSWLKYASIWILERIPEAFDLAEKMGADPSALDQRRVDHLPSLWHWFQEILKDDPEGNRAYFDPKRMSARFKHLNEFRAMAPALIDAYRSARFDDPGSWPTPADELIPAPPVIAA